MLKFRAYLEEKMRVDTTQNASVTELFPALAFNTGYKPKTIDDFQNYLLGLDLSKGKAADAFVNASNRAAGKSVIERTLEMQQRFFKDKMENAIGITNYLYSLHNVNPISKVIWGYREKPSGIPKDHAGDIFVFYKDGSKIGISLKAGTAKSKEPLKNTYVGTQYKNLKISTKSLEIDLWNRVYSKIPGVPEVANVNNFIKNKEVTKAYVDYYLSNEIEANKLYNEMLVVCREHFCKVINAMDNDSFIEWVKTTFNLQRKNDKVPLVLVKAIGTNASEKSDDIVDILPMAISHHAYLNKNSVQEYLIDISTTDKKKTMKMTIRSDSGVRASKGTSGQGRLGQYLQLKMQYSGTQ